MKLRCSSLYHHVCVRRTMRLQCTLLTIGRRLVQNKRRQVVGARPKPKNARKQFDKVCESGVPELHLEGRDLHGQQPSLVLCACVGLVQKLASVWAAPVGASGRRVWPRSFELEAPHLGSQGWSRNYAQTCGFCGQNCQSRPLARPVQWSLYVLGCGGGKPWQGAPSFPNIGKVYQMGSTPTSRRPMKERVRHRE